MTEYNLLFDWAFAQRQSIIRFGMPQGSTGWRKTHRYNAVKETIACHMEAADVSVQIEVMLLMMEQAYIASRCLDPHPHSRRNTPPKPSPQIIGLE